VLGQARPGEEREHAWATRVRPRCGPSEGKKAGSRPGLLFFVFFLFLQMLNSNNLCLFCCEFFIASKMVNFFV
jgi:hypothetical protein